VEVLFTRRAREKSIVAQSYLKRAAWEERVGETPRPEE
jgi:hypothetical protein